MLDAIRQNLEQKAKKANARSAAFQSRKRALYTEARNNAKEVVTSGVSALEDIQAKIADFQGQAAPHQKYHEDCHLPRHAHKETFDKLNSLYLPMLEELGQRRAEKINAANRMLKEFSPARQDALKEFSKNARHQLEQAILREKEAVDAAELIKRFKNLLRA
ncbi:hypothetical protein GALMADRAFT_251294 [Galerina marginata CBS 339.88]|uniref:Uncharacterized protein n=1 Tax=Galerina marginata (strain CBS 339.88) TaxID=685588 RepID=A0A067SRJ0_GALM3|nr:hypothetical protein GALMADRAFT_251294 [Galerina marginata CBS 339.88]